MKRTEARPTPVPGPVPGPVPSPIRYIAELDKLLHEPSRLAILSALSRAPGGLGYTFTRHVLGTTQGSLATHLQKLEAAGLIEIHRRYLVRRQYARLYITGAGRTAIEDHWHTLWDLQCRLESWSPEDEDAGDLTQEQFEALPLKPPDTYEHGVPPGGDDQSHKEESK